MATALSVIIPANNEAAHIGACLEALFASQALDADRPVQIIVVANGCDDDTAAIARGFTPNAAARGWSLDVIELAKGCKIGALNAGDAAAQSGARAYLDADVHVAPALLAQTAQALHTAEPRYVSGEVRLAPAKTWITRAYGRFYRQVPFMRQRAPGCGYFALNMAGRARWGDWPEIISDDTFARLSFAAPERVQVEASYDWPLVEGLGNLIKVRRRQNAGVDELAARFAELMQNDSKPRFTLPALIAAILRAPLGFAVYGWVTLAVRLKPAGTDWSRGR